MLRNAVLAAAVALGGLGFAAGAPASAAPAFVVGGSTVKIVGPVQTVGWRDRVVVREVYRPAPRVVVREVYRPAPRVVYRPYYRPAPRVVVREVYRPAPRVVYRTDRRW